MEVSRRHTDEGYVAPTSSAYLREASANLRVPLFEAELP